MKKFAVAYLSYTDNVLSIEVVEAEDWQRAIIKHSRLGDIGPEDIADNLEQVKEDFFNWDAAIDVVELSA